LRGHALNAGTDTNIDHTRLDGIRNIGNSLETTGALPVHGLDSGGLGNAGNQGGGAEFSGASTRSQDVSNGDILNEGRVDL
jgi:hypothetical protein